jgi:hypothetical protein
MPLVWSFLNMPLVTKCLVVWNSRKFISKKLGGKPAGESEYDFGVNSVADFIATAQVLEDTGVMAYDGAIAYIDKPGLQTAGATIATVEARHASYLRLLNGEVPFPKAFDEPKGAAAGMRDGGPVHNQEPL